MPGVLAVYLCASYAWGAEPRFYPSDQILLEKINQGVETDPHSPVVDFSHHLSRENAWMSFDVPAQGTTPKGKIFVFLNHADNRAEFLLIQGQTWYFDEQPLSSFSRSHLSGQSGFYEGFNRMAMGLRLSPVVDISPHLLTLDMNTIREVSVDAIDVPRPGEEVGVTVLELFKETPRVRVLPRIEIPYPWQDELNSDAFALELRTSEHDDSPKLIIFGIEDTDFEEGDKPFAHAGGDDFSDDVCREDERWDANPNSHNPSDDDLDNRLRKLMFEYIQESVSREFNGSAFAFVQKRDPDIISSLPDLSFIFDEHGRYMPEILVLMPWMQPDAGTRSDSEGTFDTSKQLVFRAGMDIDVSEHTWLLDFTRGKHEEVSLSIGSADRLNELRNELHNELSYVLPTESRVTYIEPPSQLWHVPERDSPVFRGLFPEPQAQEGLHSRNKNLNVNRPLRISDMVDRLDRPHSYFSVEGVHFLLIHPVEGGLTAQMFLIAPSTAGQRPGGAPLNTAEPFYVPADEHLRRLDVPVTEFNEAIPFHVLEREVLKHIPLETLLLATDFRESDSYFMKLEVQKRVSQALEEAGKSSSIRPAWDFASNAFKIFDIELTDDYRAYYQNHFVKVFSEFLIEEAKLLRGLRFVQLPFEDGVFVPEVGRTIQFRAKIVGQTVAFAIPQGVLRIMMLAHGAVRAPNNTGFSTESLAFSMHSAYAPYPLFGLQHMIRGPQIVSTKVLKAGLSLAGWDEAIEDEDITVTPQTAPRVYDVEHLIYKLPDGTSLDGKHIVMENTPPILSSLRLLTLKIQKNPLLAEGVKALLSTEGMTLFGVLRILFPALAGDTDQQILTKVANRSRDGIDASLFRALNLTPADIAEISSVILDSESKSLFQNILIQSLPPKSLPDVDCK